MTKITYLLYQTPLFWAKKYRGSVVCTPRTPASPPTKGWGTCCALHRTVRGCGQAAAKLLARDGPARKLGFRRGHQFLWPEHRRPVCRLVLAPARTAGAPAPLRQLLKACYHLINLTQLLAKTGENFIDVHIYFAFAGRFFGLPQRGLLLRTSRPISHAPESSLAV